MKIVNIVPGFGGTFYCGNCQRDGTFVRELRRAGHQATLLPMYLLLTINDPSVVADQDRLTIMAGNGRKIVEEKFNATKLTEQMISVYQSLISAKPL